MPTLQQRKKLGSFAGRITGSFIAFLFPLGRFHFREPVFRGEIVLVIHPNAGEEIIKSTDTRGIAERETAEDGIRGISLSIRHQTVTEVTFNFKASG